MINIVHLLLDYNKSYSSLGDGSLDQRQGFGFDANVARTIDHTIVCDLQLDILINCFP